MDFIKVKCATCQHPLLAATELRDAVAPPTLECMLCKPARYPFCIRCQLPLYVSYFHDAPEFCSECRALQSDEMRGRLDTRLYLEGFIEDTAVPRRVILEPLPFTIGRSPSSSLQINRDGVSRHHAHIDRVGGHVQVTDLQSTNGTYVNRKRIAEATSIQQGDIIHFADYEFRLLEIVDPMDFPPDICETLAGDSPSPLSFHFPTKMKEFTGLLEQGLVTGCHQMIVDRHGKPIGYELLGRGTHPDLPENPTALFTLAHSLVQEVQLSELFRR